MVYGSVSELSDNVEDASLESPTLVIIGEVVGLSRGWRRFIESGQSLQAGGEDVFLPQDTDFLYPEGSQLQEWEGHL